MTMDVMEIAVTLLLADYAQVADGKLTVVGGGWTQCGPMPTPSAVAALVSFPFSLVPHQHALRLELVDVDGYPVLLDGTPVLLEGLIELGASVDEPPHPPTVVPFAFVIPPLPLPTGRGFCWRFSVDGQSRDGWSLPFQVRAES